MKITTRTNRLKFLFVLLVISGTAAPLYFSERPIASAIYLVSLAIYIAAVAVLEKWPPAATAAFTPATLSSLFMIALISLSVSLFNEPGGAVLLILPAVYAALLAEKRGTIVIALICAVSSLLLRWQFGLPVTTQLLTILSSLLPLFAAVLVVWQQRMQLRDLRGQSHAFENIDRQTGFLNMPAFLSELAVNHDRAKQSSASYALLLIDIDRLRLLNDQYGYIEGDRVISAVADALKRSIRKEDRIARYGGDEFIIYLADAGDKTAQDIANTVSQNVYNITLSCGHKTLRTGTHAGIAVYPDSGASVEDMLTFVNRAMYRDKDFRRRTVPTEAPREAGRRQAGLEDW